MDSLIELFLRSIDALLDLITFSHWTRWQGNKVPNVRVSKQVKS